MLSSQRPLSNMGENSGIPHKFFWWKGKGQLYKREPCENYESLDEKDTSRNILQQLVNI